MTIESKTHAITTARAFAADKYPSAEIVFLGGSWAADCAHADSDLDLVIFDDLATNVSFEGTSYGGFVVEACVMPSSMAEKFFRGCAKYRSAPIPLQVVDGLLVLGDEKAALALRRTAEGALSVGPDAISEDDRNELRYELSLLLVDLIHAAPDALTAISAVAHNALSKAVIDLNRLWRADRKSLRKAVAQLDADFASQLDTALTEACNGDADLMITLCRRVLDTFGGPERRYPGFVAVLPVEPRQN